MQLLTQSALLKALGWSFFNSVWQMALVWLVYRCVLAVFRNASAHARHGLAFLFLGAGVVWAALTGAGPWPDGVFGAAAVWRTSVLQEGRQLINEALPYCSFLYLLALGFLFIRYVHQYNQSRQLIREGRDKVPPELRVFTAETARRMGIRKGVGIWFSSLVEGPVTLGFLKPVILIPLATVNQLSLAQVEAILLHELAHIKRNDYLLHLGVTILEVLFFFNPFVRWMIRDIKREREHRCDDLVLQFRYDPHAYVSALLSLATQAAGRRGRPWALAATGGSDQLLLQRAKRMLQPGEPKDRPGAGAFVFLLLILCGAFILSRSSYPGRLLPQNNKNGTPVSENSRRLSVPEENSGKPPALKTLSTLVSASPTPRSSPTPQTPKKVFTVTVASDKNDDQDRPDEPGPGERTLAITVDNKEPDPAAADGTFATDVKPDDREYSMEPSAAIILPGDKKALIRLKGQPFVPTASFSFQQSLDTLKLMEQGAYLQSLASHEVEDAVKRMQKELRAQLRLLQVTTSGEQRAALRAQRQLLEEQLKLQEQFLLKQQELERKLERAGKVRRIVVI